MIWTVMFIVGFFLNITLNNNNLMIIVKNNIIKLL